MNLGQLARSGLLVLYCFGCGRDEQDLRLTRTFREHHLELVALGVELVGVSSEGLTVQRELVEQEGLPFPLLSDEGLVLAGTLALPTVSPDKAGEYRRAVLIAGGGVVCRAIDAVAPARAVSEMVALLQAMDAGSDRWVQPPLGVARGQRSVSGHPDVGPRDLIETVRRVRADLDCRTVRAEEVLHRICERRVAQAGGGRDGSGGGTAALASDGEPPSRVGAAARERLDELIVLSWTRTLREPYDWGDWPLVQWTCSKELVEALRGYDRAAVRRVAWVCAMIACGRAGEQGIELRALAGGGAGEGVGRAVADVVAWHCQIGGVNRPGFGGGVGSLCLHYRVQPCGLITFDEVRGGSLCRE